MNSYLISKIYEDSFKANIYSTTHFRMIGLIDVDIQFCYGIERVTLAYYRSSGTNNGKIKGLWYPIVGIKMGTGSFIEFPESINSILDKTTIYGYAHRGWLAKSLFFFKNSNDPSKLKGFSSGNYYDSLLSIGMLLRNLYDNNHYFKINTLNSHTLNRLLYSKDIYDGNRYSQRENFENLIKDIFEEINFDTKHQT